jgi:hypothetical protein
MVNTSWEDLWDRLNEFYTNLVSQLKVKNVRLWSEIFHQETRANPLTGLLSLSKARPGPLGDEDLVLEWRISRRDGCLGVSADICRGDGSVLAEVPSVELAEPIEWSALVQAQEQAMTFFREHLDLITQEVCL